MVDFRATRWAILGFGLVASGCAPAQFDKASEAVTQINAAAGREAPKIAALCASAQPLLPIVGPYAVYIEATCAVGGLSASVAADPNTAIWFQGVISDARAFAATHPVAIRR